MVIRKVRATVLSPAEAVSSEPLKWGFSVNWDYQLQFESFPVQLCLCMVSLHWSSSLSCWRFLKKKPHAPTIRTYLASPLSYRRFQHMVRLLSVTGDVLSTFLLWYMKSHQLSGL